MLLESTVAQAALLKQHPVHALPIRAADAAEAGVRAVECLISSDSIRPAASRGGSGGGSSGVITYVEAAAAGAGGLPSLAALVQGGGGRLLQPHEALMW